MMERTLDFARDSPHLVVASEGALHVVDLEGDATPLELAVPDVHAFGFVDRELWVVAGTAPQLLRYTTAGTLLQGTLPLSPAAEGARLVRGGAATAAWLGATRTLLVRTPRGIVANELAAELDLVLPVGATRALWCQRQGVSLRDGATLRWLQPREGRIVDGALLSDGRTAALVVQRASSHSIVVLGMRDGAVQHRLNLVGVIAVRFAASRGAALVLAEGHRLVLVDLRFGRILADHAVEHDIGDLAIDDQGERVALRRGDRFGEVEQVLVRDLAAAGRLGNRPTPPVEPIVHESRSNTAIALPEPIARPDPFATTATLANPAALAPRAAREVARADEIDPLLASYRELVLAHTALAIARGWDEGRIAFPHTSSLPFRSEVEGVIGMLRGLAWEQVAAGQRRAADAVRAVEAAEAALAPRVSPLTALADELGLSATARAILLVVAAPALWGEVARLYGVLANDEARPLCDEHLVSMVLADRASSRDIGRELDRDAPLVRYGLVRAAATNTRPFVSLAVDRVALKLLAGASPDVELEPAVYRRVATRTLAELRIPRAVKEKAIQDVQRARAPLRIAVRGRTGSGRHALLAALAAEARRALATIDISGAVRDAKARTEDLRIALERAHAAGMLPCVDGLDLLPSDDVLAREQIREVLRRHSGPVAVRLGWDAQVPLDPGHVLVDLPPLSPSERTLAWQASIAAANLRVGDVGELAERFSVGAGVIERVCAEVALADREAERPLDDDATGRLDDAVRGHLESRLGTTANRVRRLATWSQIILPNDLLDSLTELISRIRRRSTVYDAWGFDRVMSTSRGVTALFSGGPGTGKTLVASAIANELGMDLYRVDLSRVMSKWIGETEQNLAKLFDAAEDGNAIVLFDEADSLFAKRTEVKSSNDRYANLEVNYLLQRFDTFEGIAILTTNFGTSIDSAFKRRLSLRLTFPFPDEEQREKLWRVHLPPELPIAGDFDLVAIARRYRMSGGYIRNCSLRAAFLAAEEGGMLTGDHLERAIRAEFRELGKLAESGVLE